MQTTFKEQQKFTQWWLWLLLICIGVLVIIGIYEQLYTGVPFGDKPMSDTGLMAFCIFIFILIVMFRVMTLKTEFDQDGIRMAFFPFVKKSIKWDDIKSVKMVGYGFVGGRGIRLWTRYGTIFNMKGCNGLAIELQNGKKFLIGTQRETDLVAFLKTIRKS